ncbi:MAG: hypothetical protein CM15mP62_28860 [Rhodospirillaceae bacterium]|nr:MAG: hypothetical protein CM15mP62_28860 [Rhodospirillaceae bacterium]
MEKVSRRLMASCRSRSDDNCNQTPFYAESGGQVGDTGYLKIGAEASFRVKDVQKGWGDLFTHIGVIENGSFSLGCR